MTRSPLSLAFSPTVWRWLFWLCALAVLVLALLPPDEPMPTTGWDKSNHMLAFATLFLLGQRGFGRRTGWVLAGLLAYGVLIELLQALTTYRSSDWHDVVADSAGLAIGLVIDNVYRLRRAART